MGVNAGTENAGALRRASERGARRKGLRAALFLAVAAVAATGVAILLTRYMDARTAAARIPTVPVVVAALDLPEASELRPETLAIVQWPAVSVPEGTVSDPKALTGRVVVTRLGKGELILPRHLAASDAGRGLAALLPAGMRAVAVRVNDVVGVAGFIHPGDSVDVIVTMRPNEAGASLPISKIVLQNIRVLAVGKQVEHGEKDASKAIPATVATLMVDAVQSEMLALAASKGQLLLSLRSGLDKALVETEGVVPPQLLGARPVPPAAPATPVAVARRWAKKPASPPDAPQASSTVEIFRGDMIEKRDFPKGAR